MLVQKNSDRSLVISAIEKTLLDIAKPVYDIFAERLYEEYNSHLQDCYEHPEYLNKVLKDVFGDAMPAIISSIHKNLQETVKNKPPVKELLEMICQHTPSKNL